MRPVIAAFAAAGADFVTESVADLASAIGAIEAALAGGRQPGGAATCTLIGQPA